MTQFQLQDERARMARKRLLGMILMTVGGLMALLCGLCTLAFGFVILTVPDGGAVGTLSSLLIPLIVGGLPTAVGGILFWIGRGMYREGAARLGHPERAFD